MTSGWSLRILGLAGAALVVGPAAARADATPRLITPRTPTGPTEAPPPRDHRHQVGLALAFPIGMRIISTYDGEYCGSTSAESSNGYSPVCGGRAPISLDLTLSYGVWSRFETILEFRLGLEPDVGPTPSADGPRVHHVAPGVRAFYSDALSSKVFSTAQAVFDFTGYRDGSGASLGLDVGARNLNGLMFDLDERIGVMLFVGETVSFTRWIRLELEAGVGIQGRLP